MAARYATQSFWYQRSTDGKVIFVGVGALRDSTDQAVIQCPGLFVSAKLTDKEMGCQMKAWRDAGNDTGP